MNQLVPISSLQLPALVSAAGERASTRFLEFFAANIRNPRTRRAFYRAAEDAHTQNRRPWVRLREKDGGRHVMPCHHTSRNI